MILIQKPNRMECPTSNWFIRFYKWEIDPITTTYYLNEKRVCLQNETAIDREDQ